MKHLHCSTMKKRVKSHKQTQKCFTSTKGILSTNACSQSRWCFVFCRPLCGLMCCMTFFGIPYLCLCTTVFAMSVISWWCWCFRSLRSRFRSGDTASLPRKIKTQACFLLLCLWHWLFWCATSCLRWESSRWCDQVTSGKEISNVKF